MSVLRISLVNSLTRTRVRLCDAIHSDIFVAIADDFVSFVSIFLLLIILFLDFDISESKLNAFIENFCCCNQLDAHFVSMQFERITLKTLH